jgi:hypothetical protein
MTVLVLDVAERDLENGQDFYDAKEDSLGDYFLESLSADIESLSIFAGIHPKVGRFHRALAHVFPYAIFYALTQDTVFVWAILDCRRRPSWIHKQLRSRK